MAGNRKIKETLKKSFSLSPKWEEGLRKGVFHVGRGVERLIGEVSKLKSGLVRATSSAQPVLSLEGQISPPKLKEIISLASDKIVTPSIPNLVDKTAIEIREGSSSLITALKGRGASIATHTDIGGGAGSYDKKNKDDIPSVKSVAWNLPFEDGFFDYSVGCFATQFQGDMTKTIKEFSRLLVIGGEGVIVDFHPFGLYSKRGSYRLKPSGSTVKGIEDYFRLCRSFSLKVVDVKEAFIDDVVRKLFVTDEEKASFRVVKGTPLLIFLYVKKGG